MARINGEEVKLPGGTTIEKYVTLKGYNMSFIAVECNGQIVKKKDYSKVVINPDDKIEIVSFVGGG